MESKMERKSITLMEIDLSTYSDVYGYIYVTENLVNNKKYVGQHKGNKKDMSYFGSGVLIRKAIEKYEKSNFSVRVID